MDAVEGGVGVDAGGLEETPATTSQDPSSVVRPSSSPPSFAERPSEFLRMLELRALRLFHGETANLLGKFLLGKSQTILYYLLSLRHCRSNVIFLPLFRYSAFMIHQRLAETGRVGER
uniref:Uncharacterized protein n=1 Tax=Vespula pensylvanica TaxID=30213 RepID=A0A834NYB3_VESPE|nr:hypothetical protein H0235_009211 [Vespula pensylvanica]